MIDFKTLRVWELFHEIALDIYRITRKFPLEELYGLTSQMRKSASSAPTNTAEGCGRNTDPDLAKFLTIAMGSASELEYQLLLSKNLEYIDQDEYETIVEKLITAKKMLNTFLQKVRARIPTKRRYPKP
ncbi:MAG: four helix bundle protein [Tunicatimonas sp.]